jgi:glycosyltransferase involved in cell wall biosynthesis
VTPLEFSLLLPVYAGDRPEFLRAAFTSSVQEQTQRPSEVVVVVDGPIPDELRSMIDSLIAASPVPARAVELPRNRGLAEALTVGLQACTHDVVARMDADDVSLPARFERQAEAIARGLDLVGTGMFEFATDNGSVLGKRLPPVGPERIAKYAKFHDPFNHPTVMYRKAAVERAGGYEELGLMEDYWLFARMLHSGVRADNLPEPLLMYRVSDGAYRRRGGLGQLRAEVRLQRAFRRMRFTTRAEALRNLAIRGGYRLIPEMVRKVMYRRLIARGFRSGIERPTL